MKEVLIFLFLFLAVFGLVLFIFNGRFIYTQVKYKLIGFPPVSADTEIFQALQQEAATTQADEESLQIPERLVIPKLSVDAPIVWPENIGEPAFQAALEKGVVFWPESSLPGQKGTMVVLGHSSAYPWYRGNYGSIFSLLDQLQTGDEIFVFSPQKKYTFRVTGKEIEVPENLNILNQKEESLLYLVSCWPVKTNWKRIVIKAISVDNI